MAYNKIKMFEEYVNLNEGNILTYMPGDTNKPSKNLHVPDVAKFFCELLEKKKPFTAIVNNEGSEFGPAKKADVDDPADYFDRIESEFDVVGVEGFKDKVNTNGKLTFTETYPITDPAEAKKTNPNNIAIVLVDKKGRNWKVQIGKIEEVSVGSSLKDKVYIGEEFKVEGKGKCYVADYDGKDVTVQFEDTKETMSLAAWKKIGKR